jgi:hypothetical protein
MKRPAKIAGPVHQNAYLTLAFTARPVIERAAWPSPSISV